MLAGSWFLHVYIKHETNGHETNSINSIVIKFGRRASTLHIVLFVSCSCSCSYLLLLTISNI